MMNRYPRRYSAGYRRGRRGGTVRWILLAVGLLGSAGFGYTCLHHDPAKGQETFVIAASGTANEPRPGLPGDIIQKLWSAGGASTAASGYVVNPATGVATAVSLTPRLPDNQVDHGPTRDSVLNADVSHLQRVLAGERAQGPFDLLATINAAVRAVPPPATLILVSSGLSTSGGLDFRQAGWYASPSSLAAQLKARHLLPSLAGYRVVFSGLGVVDGRQPSLPLPAQEIVKNYWTAICQAASAASCTVDDMSRPVSPSLSAIPVPRVPVPQVGSYRGPHNKVQADLPDALLFAFDSATLLPAANGILEPLVERSRRHHLLVSVAGYASPDGGTAAYDLTLSQRRAQAVRDRLVSLGLPASWITKITGVGTAGHGPSSCLVHGHLVETICAKLRRVVIVMTPFRSQP